MTGGTCASLGIQVDGAHEAASLREAIAGAEAVFVGGGNSFRLLKRLTALDALGDLGLPAAFDAGQG